MAEWDDKPKAGEIWVWREGTSGEEVHYLTTDSDARARAESIIMNGEMLSHTSRPIFWNADMKDRMEKWTRMPTSMEVPWRYCSCGKARDPLDYICPECRASLFARP